MHEWGFKQYRKQSPHSVALKSSEPNQDVPNSAPGTSFVTVAGASTSKSFFSSLSLSRSDLTTPFPFLASFPTSALTNLANKSKFQLFSHKDYGLRKSKRDVRTVDKYIELAIVLDQSMVTSRNSTLGSLNNINTAMSDALQIINCVDSYFRMIKTRVSVVYIETWAHSNQIDVRDDVRQTLLNFMEYSSRKLYKVTMDAAHLLVGRPFRSGEVGMAVPDTICTAKAVGISQDANIYEPHLTAISVTHMLGHNIGMGHDEETKESGNKSAEFCKCNDWWGCIMAKSILNEDRIQPYHFSRSSIDEYNNALRGGNGICLFNKPGKLEDFRSCGNGLIEDGEECDCGTFQECQKNPCCDPITCKLLLEAECATGACCVNCKLKRRGQLCRAAADECDLPERCDGSSGECPSDVFKKNGDQCKNGQGVCFNGECPTLNEQCSVIWGEKSHASESICYKQFNAQGTIRGNCGVDRDGNHVKCSEENIMCGSLQCQFGNKIPLFKVKNQEYSRTMVYIAGSEYECKVARGSIRSDIANMGMIQDGTKCSENKICINQTCTPIEMLTIDQESCPLSYSGEICSGHGLCSNQNTCACDNGWGGINCSDLLSMNDLNANEKLPPILPGRESGRATTSNPLAELLPVPVGEPNAVDPIADVNLTRQIRDYDSQKKSLSAAQLVMILVSIVGCVFIFFALLAMCYRRRSLLPEKSERSLIKKQQQMSAARGFPGAFDIDNHPLGGTGFGGSGDGGNSLSRIITFGSMPSYRDEKMIEMKHQQQQQQKQQQQNIPPPPPPISMPPQSQHQASQTPTASAQHHASMYNKDNRKDSATSPVDPALMDQDDELLLMDDGPTRFIELSPNNLPKLSVKDKLLAAAAAAAAAAGNNSQQQHRWATILSQAMPLDIGGANTVTTSASTTATTPLLQEESGSLHHSHHSLHRQSSQGTGSVTSESPLTEVERTLKSLNGYHEDILEALHHAQQRQHHQKSLECIRSAPGSGAGSVGPGSGGEGSGPGSLGRQTPNELSQKAFGLESDYGGLLKISEHFQNTSSPDSHLMSNSNSNASTIKIRNLAHLLQQLDEIGQPISSANSDDVRMPDPDTDRHLYVGGASSVRSVQSSDDRRSSRPMCARHTVQPTLSLDSQLVEQDLAYLLAGTTAATPNTNENIQSFTRPRPSIGNTANRQLAAPTGSRGARPLGNMLNPYQTPTSSYFTTLPPLSPSTTTSTTSTAREGHEDEAEEYDYENVGLASFKPTIITHPLTTTLVTTTASSISSTSADAATDSTAAKHGYANDKQLLHFTTAMARRDESTIPISTAATATTTTATATATASTANCTVPLDGSTTIARFKVTHVPESEHIEDSSESREREELFLIDQLSKIQLNDSSVEDAPSDTSACGPLNQVSSLSSSIGTATSCCSSSSTTSTSSVSFCACTTNLNQKSATTTVSYTTAQQSTVSITLSSSSISSSAAATSTSVFSDYQPKTAVPIVKLFRKHRPSALYQEYKV